MNECDEFEAFWAKLAGNYPCYGEENHRAIAQNAWLSACAWQREKDAVICQQLNTKYGDQSADAIREQK